MPPRKAIDAETVTPVVEGAAIGNVDAEVLLDDLANTQDLVLKQEQMIRRLAEQVEALQRLNDPGEHAPQPVQQPPVLAEGAKRYRSRYTEAIFMRVGTGHEMHGGVAVPVPVLTGKPIEFNGGVYETSDADEIEFLEAHPGNGTEFWEDALAVRRHSQVEVTDGLKSANTTPRVPLAAPMGQ